MNQPARIVSLKQREERTREAGGWRAGKPVEDPEKLKSWGFVTARPSEYLVHVRNGVVRQASSGQGATCFKWPLDAVAVVPTSLQRLQFSADQVTAERVGVEVTGLAVYRIAEPLLAYRLLNFSFPERAQEKLEETLAAMFVGASRRLIAGLSVDDCLQKRKSALAQELLREIAPVVGGKGRVDDRTVQGWGVVIDTIEIQEVRILSEKVFAAMQAPFRATLEQKAREARASAEEEVERQEAAHRRGIEEAKIEAGAAVAARRAEAARVVAETEAQDAVRRIARKADEATAELAANRVVEESRAEEAVRRIARKADEATAELAAHELLARAQEQAAALTRAEAQAGAELRRLAAQLALLEGKGEAEVELARAGAAEIRAGAQARVLTAQKLPELAAAIGSRIGEVKIQQWGGDGNPFGSLVQAVTAVLELARNPGA